MGQADWNDLDSSLTTATLMRGVTAGLTPPNGGGSFVYGYNSLDGTVAGAHGKFVDLSGFTPTGSGPAVADGGGSVRGALKRVASTNNTGFTPMLFFAAQGSPPSVNDAAYMLGLLDADPYEIALAKGPIVGGIVEGGDDLTILRRSSAQYAMSDDLWHHLRLDTIVEPNGDVLLQVFENDLSVNPITAPVWASVPGISDYIDDLLQIASGSAPLLGGYVGFAMAISNALNRRAAFDGIEAYRAT